MTKWSWEYSWQGDKKGFNAQCNLLLTWQQCKEYAAMLLYGMIPAEYLHFCDRRQFEGFYLKTSFVVLSSPLESSAHEGSNDNDGSICGSDSAFYKQSEGERCGWWTGSVLWRCRWVISATIIIDIIFSTLQSFLACCGSHIDFFPPFVPFFHFLKRLSCYVYCSLIVAW